MTGLHKMPFETFRGYLAGINAHFELNLQRLDLTI